MMTTIITIITCLFCEILFIVIILFTHTRPDFIIFVVVYIFHLINFISSNYLRKFPISFDSSLLNQETPTRGKIVDDTRMQTTTAPLVLEIDTERREIDPESLQT